MSHPSNPITPIINPVPPKRIGQAPVPKKPEKLPEKQHQPKRETMSDKEKKTVKGAILRVIINQIWYFIRTWLVAKPVYITAPDEVGNIVPIRDPETGQKKVNWVATIAGRVVQLLGVLGWLPVIVLGQPLEWWLDILQKIGSVLF